MRPTVLLLCALLLGPLPAAAQATGLTIAQVQSRFRGMNEVHIRKCDFNGDSLIDSKEINCVRGIYQQMYIDE